MSILLSRVREHAFIAATTTAVIDYDPLRELFVSRQEQLEFSARKLLALIHWRAGARQVKQSWQGFLIIQVEHLSCRLTRRAVAQLARSYRSNETYQAQFPLCRRFFGEGIAGD